jgi:hypothetical protein
MSNKQVRNFMRILHFVGAGVIGTYIYSPWGDDPTFTAAVQFIIIPLLSLTGVVMWKQAWVGKLLRVQRQQA